MALSNIYSVPPSYEEANAVLTHLNDTNSLYVEEAKWYQALIYLKIDKTTAANKLLKEIVTTESWNHSKAKKLLGE